ncbi:coiled-coil domain-containing protein 130 homolog [Limulus polyphemus]|uniref:Coiled-coil domain-containing protein 130 homolog n=1 Tax=Limulus polyphemus TaxID=6850 RepID=A0ABM1C269_LIMPO|nr:coiled-coil domain-containing protein 130 homolog [Limulus polyphemus]
MAERKAVNKYYPPDWTPKMGSINKYRGTHALRERARKLSQGILIIRFEMPYNIWCEGCGNHIGMGVRYNAEKSKVGMYYTTPIYKFRMKCHLCDNHFEIQTDPQNLDYVILNGARRQERRWDPMQNQQVAPDDKDVSNKLATDAMFRIEHGVEDKAKLKSLAPSLGQLEQHQDRWKDPYSMNKLLRQKFREKKKELLVAEASDKALLERSSLDIKLMPETDDDVKLAGLLKLSSTETFEERKRQKREEIQFKPLFNAPSCTARESTTFGRSLNSLVHPRQKLISSLAQQRLQELTKPLTRKDLGILPRKPESTSSAHESENQEEKSVKPRLALFGIIRICE